VKHTTGAAATCNAARGECPMSWLVLGHGGSSTQGTTLEVTALPGCEDDCPRIGLSGVANAPGVTWEGELEITGTSGRTTVLLRYTERPEGQWTGAMHYFGNFDDRGIDEWLAEPKMLPHEPLPHEAAAACNFEARAK